MRRIDPTRRCKRVEEWPAPDQAAWAAALQPSQDPDRSKVAEHWAEATRHLVVSGHGRWLTWLEQQGLLDPRQSPGERVTPERVAAYMADLRRNAAEATVAVRLEQLGHAMRAMAPTQPWQWVQQFAAQLRAAALRPRRPASPQERQSAADPGPPANRCTPLAEWPALDQAAWAAALLPGDVFDPGGVATTWALATQKMVVQGYGHWLTWLARHNALDPSLAPAARVSRERLFGYLQELRASVASFTVATRIQQVGNALRAMAPESDWRWIQRAADRTRSTASSVRNKRAQLQSPDQLVRFGLSLMAQADDPASASPAVRAATYRDGLMIALLALRPIRRRNLAAILCDRHLVRRGAEWWLVFAAEETKTRQLLEFPFPAELVPLLQRYLQQHRPVLLAQGHRQDGPVTALWVAKSGTQMGPAAITHQVRQRTGTAFETALGPHRFRDCAATAIAINAPDDIQLIRPILGHTTLATSERHYNLAGSLEAGRRHAATITELRKRKP